MSAALSPRWKGADLRISQSDWEMFAAASATDVAGRDLFVDLLAKYLKAGRVDAAFPE